MVMNEVSETINTHHPKFNEVLEIRSSYEKTVEQRISQELHEELVVGESHTVVHPGTRKRTGQSGKISRLQARFNSGFRVL